MREGLRRLWAAPLWAHVAALALLLLALVPLIGTASSFSPDESVVITQARSLNSGDGWIVEHPFAEVDPEDQFYPLAGSNQGDSGQAPFAKHPVYPLMLAALDSVGGVAAMVVLSVLGTVAAAAFAALLAREVTGGLERPALWAVGVASPLLLDAYLLIAHSLGAAVVTAATLAVLRAVRRERPALLMVGGSLLVALGVLLRAEALIFGLAIGAATVAVGLARRRPALLAWGFALGATAMASAVLEKWLVSVLIGELPGGVAPPAPEGDFLAARFEGFLNTWLRPTLEVPSAIDLVLVVVCVLAVAAVAVLRWRAHRPHMLVVLSVVSTGMCAFAVLADLERVVPGLLIAFPLAVFGIGLVDRVSLEPSGRLVLTATAALFIAGVLATQYRVGGSAEWGGRYFALAVPILTVLAVDGLARRAPALPAGTRRWAGAGLVACSGLMAVAAVSSITGVHDYYEAVVTKMEVVGRSTSPGDGGGAVVVSAYPNIARRGWPTNAEQRWLYNSEKELGGELAMRLDRFGIEELLFVHMNNDDVEPYLGRYAVDAGRSFTMGRWEVSVLVAKP